MSRGKRITKVVPCRYCARTTLLAKTRVCDFCYEIKTRAEKEPCIAELIVTDVLKRKGRVLIPARKGWRPKVKPKRKP